MARRQSKSAARGFVVLIFLLIFAVGGGMIVGSALKDRSRHYGTPSQQRYLPRVKLPNWHEQQSVPQDNSLYSDYDVWGSQSTSSSDWITNQPLPPECYHDSGSLNVCNICRSQNLGIHVQFNANGSMTFSCNY